MCLEGRELFSCMGGKSDEVFLLGSQTQDTKMMITERVYGTPDQPIVKQIRRKADVDPLAILNCHQPLGILVI